jgi:hypothetical protein
MLLGMDRLAALSPGLLVVLITVEVLLIGWGERYVNGTIYSRAPWRPLSYPFLLPGTVLHELAHACAAWALGLGVAKVVISLRPTTDPDGHAVMGWVVPRRSAPGRDAIMCVAPVILVPPVLLAVTLVALNLPSDWSGASLAWLVVVGLGSLGAFPSSNDRDIISNRGALTVVAACLLAGLALYALGALSLVLAGAALALLVPAGLFAFVFGLVTLK